MTAHQRKLIPITNWNSKDIDTMLFNRQCCKELFVKPRFKMSLLPPLRDFGQTMDWIKCAQERNGLEKFSNKGSIGSLRTIFRVLRKTTHKSLFFRTTDKTYVDISRHFAIENSAVTFSVHPTFHPTTNWRQSINILTCIVDPVKLAIYPHGLEAFNIQTERLQTNLLSQSKR